MQRVTFTNSKGESIVLGYQEPFFLNKIEGLGDVEANIQSQKSPGQDGSTPTGTTLEERFIPIEVVITEEYYTNRQTISRIFNPRIGPGLLVYENDVVRREIIAQPEHVPKFPDERPRVGQLAIIDLVCHNPYWKSELKVEQLNTWEGKFKFPLRLPTKFGAQAKSKSKILINNGEVETPIFITFNGPATAPISITNLTTDEFIEVNQSLLEGERLEINTAFGQKSVTKVSYDGTRANVFHYINLQSTFFDLEVGNNLIDYSMGADYERAGVVISWHNRYGGI